MPTISMFYGIIIRMYNNGEHNPPHFHAQYQGKVAVFDMDGNLKEGEMEVKTWPTLYGASLQSNPAKTILC